MRKIAVEEAFLTPRMADAMRDVALSDVKGSDAFLTKAMYLGGGVGPIAAFRDNLLDIEDRRLREMDELGIDMQILSLTAPGVQMLEPALAGDVAAESNDYLADLIARHPGRFAGLASFAPQVPKEAVKEIERAAGPLKLNGLIVNSHTNNEYYDSEKYWPIFEAAEALDMPLYIHPRGPSDQLAGAFAGSGLEGAIWGYGMEAGTHCMRLIVSGLFDRFPKLQIVIGHMGEAIPFWLWRVDFMHRRTSGAGSMPKLRLTPTETFKRNFHITTSGQENLLALRFCVDTLGVEKVMWAIDYPYQPMAESVAFMDNAPLSEADRALVFAGNAERVFKIKPL